MRVRAPGTNSMIPGRRPPGRGPDGVSRGGQPHSRAAYGLPGPGGLAAWWKPALTAALPGPGLLDATGRWTWWSPGRAPGTCQHLRDGSPARRALRRPDRT